jgi:hypothetical protein
MLHQYLAIPPSIRLQYYTLNITDNTLASIASQSPPGVQKGQCIYNYGFAKKESLRGYNSGVASKPSR